MCDKVIEISNVNKSFKDLKAVNDLSLVINKGEYIALLGPNGAGKTTLIEMIEGIQKPDQGTIKILDKQWGEDDAFLHSNIGLSLQETKFIDKLTVRETANLFGSFYKLPSSRTDEVLELVNLTSKSKAYVVNLSGGQRQRLALGIALLNQPQILLLDEPTTGLDPASRREIWNILQDLKKKHNTTMILTTHYMEEAEVLCERILIMDKGQFLAQGTLHELTTKYGEGDVICFTVDGSWKEPATSEVKGLKKFIWTEEGKKGKAIVDSLAEDLPSFITFLNKNNLKILELEGKRVTLDDLFISMTGRHLYE